jgi:hypothetical protein
MNPRHTALFLALLVARFADAEPPQLPVALPSPAPSAVWTPATVSATPTPALAPRSDPAAGRQADPAFAATPEKKIAGNPASQQDPQPTPSPVAAIQPAQSDLLSTLANRQKSTHTAHNR